MVRKNQFTAAQIDLLLKWTFFVFPQTFEHYFIYVEFTGIQQQQQQNPNKHATLF